MKESLFLISKLYYFSDIAHKLHCYKGKYGNENM